MRSLIKSYKLGLILIFVGVIGMVTLATTSVQANHAGCANFYNRCVSHGYFTGQNYNIGSGHGTYVMSGGQPKNLDSRGGMPVYNVNEFVGYIHNRLHDGAPGDANAKYQDTTGAAFIVNTMLGRWGTDYGSRDAGVIYARNNFAEWEQRVRWYDSQNLIEWDRKYAYPVGFENSLYARDIRDEVYVNHPEYQAEYTIMIHAPGHGPGSGDPRREFQIKKNCGNPIGANTALRSVPTPPPPPPPVTIRGRVFNWPNQLSAGGISGVRIHGCEAGNVVTDGNGYFTFTVPRGSGFCVRVDGGAPSNSVGPYIRPWSEGYPGQSPGCPGFGTSTSSPTVNHSGGNRNYCAPRGYECQTAGVHQRNPYPACSFIDRNWDEGYDIIFRRDVVPEISAAAQCPSGGTSGRVTVTVRDNDGSPLSVRYRTRVNGGTWTPLGDPFNVNSGSSFNVPNMASRNEYDVHTFEFVTRGVGPHGGAGPADSERRASVDYGQGGTRACRHRTFTITPSVNQPELLPDDETAERASFSATATANIDNVGGSPPTTVRNVRLSRTYFILRPGVAARIPITSPNRSGGDPLNRGVPVTGLTISDGPSNLNPRPQLGDQVCIGFTVRPTGNLIDTAGNIMPNNNGNGVTSPEVTACDRVMAKPYFRVYGGDISAGSSACRGWSASNMPGMITAFNSTATPGKGSGTQLAALAIGAIHEFSSATGRTAAPVPPKGLAFANVSASGAWGGSMGVSSCPHDYFGTQQTDGEFTGPDFNVSGWNRNMRTASGVRVSGVVDIYNQVTLYVDGDAVISDNISYALPPAPRSGWSYTEIPNFTLVARGNIYIGSNVTEMAGTYIAQPKNISDPAAGGGEIYTCAFGMNPPTEAQLTRVTGAPGNDNCRNQLTINGSFIAKRVRLLRTNGSLKDSAPNENRASTTMGERFIFSPEAWLSSAIRPIGGYESYDAITTLPPVL